jgi:hypothetical protein
MKTLVILYAVLSSSVYAQVLYDANGHIEVIVKHRQVA